MRQVVLDTETTGLEVEQGHRIIEIGALELVDRVATGRRLQHYINPGREVEAGALEVHGITDEFLADKPGFDEVADSFLAFIKDSELIIHNAPFDLGFLNFELSLLAGPVTNVEQQVNVLDTLALARELHPGQRNSLDALCRRYSIDNSHRSLHGALLDAEILADVYLAMTGGQTDLGLTIEMPDNSGSSAEFATAKDVEIRVISASAEEIELHQQRLKQIHKASKNNCLWLELVDQE